MDEEYEELIVEINTVLRYDEKGRERTRRAIEIALKHKYINNLVMRSVLAEAFPAYLSFFADMLGITPFKLSEKMRTIQGFETEKYLKRSLRYYISQYKVK